VAIMASRLARITRDLEELNQLLDERAPEEEPVAQ
jgi:hypothetical protein